MFLIECPYCGVREQSEFAYHGEAHIVRPADPAACGDAEWGEYLFFRDNPKGWHRERWAHAHGCRKWFIVLRDTATDRIHSSYEVFAEPRPQAAESAAQPADDAAAMPTTNVQPQ